MPPVFGACPFRDTSAPLFRAAEYPHLQIKSAGAAGGQHVRQASPRHLWRGTQHQRPLRGAWPIISWSLCVPRCEIIQVPWAGSYSEGWEKNPGTLVLLPSSSEILICSGTEHAQLPLTSQGAAGAQHPLKTRLDGECGGGTARDTPASAPQSRRAVWILMQTTAASKGLCWV